MIQVGGAWTIAQAACAPTAWKSSACSTSPPLPMHRQCMTNGCQWAATWMRSSSLFREAGCWLVIKISTASLANSARQFSYAAGPMYRERPERPERQYLLWQTVSVLSAMRLKIARKLSLVGIWCAFLAGQCAAAVVHYAVPSDLRSFLYRTFRCGCENYNTHIL